VRGGVHESAPGCLPLHCTFCTGHPGVLIPAQGPHATVGGHGSRQECAARETCSALAQARLSRNRCRIACEIAGRVRAAVRFSTPVFAALSVCRPDRGGQGPRRGPAGARLVGGARVSAL